MSAETEAFQHGSGHRAFACHTDADRSRVWTALTDPALTACYLYGLALHSTWAPDAPIDGRHDGQVVLTGRVLCAQTCERLSYLLRAGPHDPPIYLTWLIRPSGSGCAVHLKLDEIDCADSEEAADDTWLPVIARLQKVLDAG